MFARIWRFSTALCDYKGILRKISNKSVIDVAFVTNIRDNVDVRRYLEKWHPPKGHFNGPRYWLNGVIGRTRAIDTVTEDLLTSKGRRRAKEQFVSAVQWAQGNGAKIILLAASTKRLFGKDGKKLKEMFPNLIFTIGDNGTMLILQKETLRALREANLKPRRCLIGVIGPYGFLGEIIVKTLKKAGHDIIGVGPNVSALHDISNKYGMEVCRSFAEMGKVDAVIACTHSKKVRLNSESINLIRRHNKKLLVVDVAEPSNLTKEEYEKCKTIVIRQDAGNAYSPHLKYVLGAISYKMFRLSKGVVFGCFAEALSLATALQYGEDIASKNWFLVNEENMKIIEKMFEINGFTVPSPRCFGKPIKSFNLELI